MACSMCRVCEWDCTAAIAAMQADPVLSRLPNTGPPPTASRDVASLTDRFQDALDLFKRINAELVARYARRDAEKTATATGAAAGPGSESPGPS